MLAIIFLIMLVIVLFRAGVQGRENPTLTKATFIIGIITTLLTIASLIIRKYWDSMELILAIVSVLFLFLLKPIVRKLLDLYDLHNQIKPDMHDRIYTRYEVHGADSDDDFNDNNSR